MVAGCFACFLCTCLLHLLLGLQDAEASLCPPPVLHKRVGDTLELPSNAPRGETEGRWRFKEKLISISGNAVPGNHFEGRISVNPKNLNLTVRNLTVQDFGYFQFGFIQGGTQRQTICVELQVHEPITQKPVLIVLESRLSTNDSCRVKLQCSDGGHHSSSNSSNSSSSVTYSWTVRNQTVGSSWLLDTMLTVDDDGGAEVTCTTSNFVSSMSASERVDCPGLPGDDREFITVLYIALGSSILVIITIIIISLSVHHCKRKHSAGSVETAETTLYADITEITSQDETSRKAQSSLYETIDNRIPQVVTGQTVYDQIQLCRIKEAPLSFYQEVP